MSERAAKVDDICNRLAIRFEEILPRLPMKGLGQKRSSKDVVPDVEAGLSRFYAAAREERIRHRLGILARARVAFGLQKRLLAAGYAPDLVKQVLFALLLSAFAGRQV